MNPAMVWPLLRPLRPDLFFCLLFSAWRRNGGSLFEPEKQVAGGIIDRDGIGAVGSGNTVAAGRPAGGVGKIAVLLQSPSARVLPKQRHGIARVRNVKRRGAEGLHHGNQRPKTSGHGIISASHRAAGSVIVLADGAADGILAVGAGAAATR